MLFLAHRSLEYAHHLLLIADLTAQCAQILLFFGEHAAHPSFVCAELAVMSYLGLIRACHQHQQPQHLGLIAHLCLQSADLGRYSRKYCPSVQHYVAD